MHRNLLGSVPDRLGALRRVADGGAPGRVLGAGGGGRVLGAGAVGRALGRMLGGLRRGALEILFPPRCLGCRRRGVLLCQACRGALPELPPGACRRCAAVRPPATRRCRECGRLAPALGAVRAAYAYQGTARRAVHVLKFRAGHQVAPLLGALVCENLRQRPLRAEVLVPVPLAPHRQRTRGYNQAALLAEQVVGATGGTLLAAALGREDRPAQAGLRGAERLANLRGSIHCRDPAGVRGKRVLLVDDVMTTGATLSACAEALSEAGAREVLALVFARTLARLPAASAEVAD